MVKVIQQHDKVIKNHGHEKKLANMVEYNSPLFCGEQLDGLDPPCCERNAGGKNLVKIRSDAKEICIDVEHCELQDHRSCFSINPSMTKSLA